MSDNPNLRGPQDRSRLAGLQPHEVDYAARILQGEFLNKSRQQIEDAIRQCAAEPRFHNNRDMVMNCARLKLRNS
jgi:hypothetical protein